MFQLYTKIPSIDFDGKCNNSLLKESKYKYCGLVLVHDVGSEICCVKHKNIKLIMCCMVKENQHQPGLQLLTLRPQPN